MGILFDDGEGGCIDIIDYNLWLFSMFDKGLGGELLYSVN